MGQSDKRRGRAGRIGTVDTSLGVTPLFTLCDVKQIKCNYAFMWLDRALCFINMVFHSHKVNKLGQYAMNKSLWLAEYK